MNQRAYRIVDAGLHSAPNQGGCQATIKTLDLHGSQTRSHSEKVCNYTVLNLKLAGALQHNNRQASQGPWGWLNSTQTLQQSHPRTPSFRKMVVKAFQGPEYPLLAACSRTFTVSKAKPEAMFAEPATQPAM